VAYIYHNHGIFKPSKYRKTRLNKRALLQEVKTLHRKLFSAYAAGDAKKLDESCSLNMQQALQSRLSKRRPGETSTWRLIRYVKKPRIVSAKTHLTGMQYKGLDVAEQQVVVKMVTEQGLRTDYVALSKAAKGWEVKEQDELEAMHGDVAREAKIGEEKIRILQENVVVNRRLLERVWTEWKIMGFVAELKEVEELKESAEASDSESKVNTTEAVTA
jgi:hypothetical protein